MLFLILSILTSSLIQVIFKYFSKHEVDNIQAIPVNYLTCLLIGLLFNSAPITNSELFSFQNAWFIHSFSLGLMFIVIFLAMAKCAQEISISVGAVAAKMGVLFPVVFGWFFLKEEITPILFTGISLSLVSILLVGRLHPDHPLKGTRLALLPVVIFLGSGFIDTNLKILENNYFEQVDAHHIVSAIFLGAFISGMVLIAYNYIRKRHRIKKKNLIAGVLLGIPNYFSIYFLMRALHHKGALTVYVMPFNNVGIVLLSVVLSVIIFREQLNNKTKWGIFVAMLSIVLIGLSDI